MTENPKTGTVLFQTSEGIGNTPRDTDETWELDGKIWRLLVPSTNTILQRAGNIVSDLGRKQVLSLGFIEQSIILHLRTLTLTANRWTTVHECDRCQGSCSFLIVKVDHATCTFSELRGRGFSVTSATGDQFRVLPDQRSG